MNTTERDRWPGLCGAAVAHRVYQLRQAEQDAAVAQERIANDGTDINVNYHALKFCTRSGERHTTIDIGEVNRADAQRLLITTSDFKYHNRLVKLIDACEDPDAWQIEDIGWNNTYSAIYWITWSCPVNCLRLKGNPYRYQQDELKPNGSKNSHAIKLKGNN